MFLDDISVFLAALGIWALNQAWYGRRLHRRYDEQTVLSMTTVGPDETNEAMTIRRKRTTKQAYLYHSRLQLAGYACLGIAGAIWAFLLLAEA
jgi:hypothetical protein